MLTSYSNFTPGLDSVHQNSHLNSIPPSLYGDLSFCEAFKPLHDNPAVFPSHRSIGFTLSTLRACIPTNVGNSSKKKELVSLLPSLVYTTYSSKEISLKEPSQKKEEEEEEEAEEEAAEEPEII